MVGRHRASWLVGFVVLGADVGVKVLGRRVLSPDGFSLLPGVDVWVISNPAGPFGQGPVWFAAIVGAVVLVLLLRQRRDGQGDLPLSLVVGGGVANLGERVLFGRTTDLVVLGNITALNLADVAILVGLVWLFVSALSARRPAVP